MSQSTTRRAVVAGIAAVPAAAIPAVALPQAPDPIFAAIVEHKGATLRYFAALDVSSRLLPGSSKYKRAAATTSSASDAQREASFALYRAPTTLAGIVAMIEYIEQYNGGLLKLGDCESIASEWPDRGGFVDVDADGTETGFVILSELLPVLRRLAGEAVQS